MYLPWEIQLIINEIIDTSDSEPAYLNEHKGLNAVGMDLRDSLFCFVISITNNTNYGVGRVSLIPSYE